MLFRNAVISHVLLGIITVFAGPALDNPSSHVSAGPFFVDFGAHIGF